MLAKRIRHHYPLIAIVGRTNVGKSTLFNALTGKKRALVSKIAGTTRDANIGDFEWNRQTFTLVDTGGFMDFAYLASKKTNATTIDERVQKQGRDFITKSDLILFLVDTKDGLLPDDISMAKILKKILPDTGKVVLVANKADSSRERPEASVFNRLGLGEPAIISAATGSGTGDLLDSIVERFADWQDEPELVAEPTDNIRVAIFGKPNVGKSSLLNAILGYERVIVSPEAHTTREPQDTVIDYQDKRITIVDTAGIHKQGLKTGPSKTKDALMKRLEHQGIAATLRTLDHVDIVLLVLDINEELTKQDVKLVEEILERRKSLIIVANKWDLISERDTQVYSQQIYRHIPFAQFAPIQFISAKTHEKVHKILDLIIKINHNRHLEIPADQLAAFADWCVARHKPTKGKGNRYPKLKRFTQTGNNPPEFAVKIGAKEYLADSYLNFLVNRLRERYDLEGTPVKIWVEKANAVHGKADQ